MYFKTPPLLGVGEEEDIVDTGDVIAGFAGAGADSAGAAV
jgi:hypothetical protein